MTRRFSVLIAFTLLLAVLGGCGDTAGNEFNKGRGFAEREDWDTAIASYSEAIRLKPDDPASHPVTPADIVATIYRCLGINPDTPVYEPNGRPVPVRHGGQPIEELLA